jgi:hypothetical protein
MNVPSVPELSQQDTELISADPRERLREALERSASGTTQRDDLQEPRLAPVTRHGAQKLRVSGVRRQDADDVGLIGLEDGWRASLLAHGAEDGGNSLSFCLSELKAAEEPRE